MREGEEGCGILANEYICAHWAQINIGDLSPYVVKSADSKKYFKRGSWKGVLYEHEGQKTYFL